MTRNETLASGDSDYKAMSWSTTTGSQPLNQGATPQLGGGMSSQVTLIIQWNFVQNFTVLAKNIVMSVLAPLVNPLSFKKTI